MRGEEEEEEEKSVLEMKNSNDLDSISTPPRPRKAPMEKPLVYGAGGADS